MQAGDCNENAGARWLWHRLPVGGSTTGAGAVCIGIEGAAGGGSGGHVCLRCGEVGDCAGLPCCCYLKKEMRH